MDDASKDIQGNQKKIGCIDDINDSWFEAVGHAKGGQKILCLIPLDRKKIWNNTGERHDVKNASCSLGNLCKQSD